jgi:hypothetical protein
MQVSMWHRLLSRMSLERFPVSLPLLLLLLPHQRLTAVPLQVCVLLTPASLSVSVGGDVLLSGQLFAEVKAEDSTWFIGEGFSLGEGCRVRLARETSHCSCVVTECDADCCCCLLLLLADDSILHITLLKRNRKGSYQDGCTAADTFWFGLLAGARGVDRLPGAHPPTHYYSAASEPDC